jgi:hypothetical protein
MPIIEITLENESVSAFRDIVVEKLKLQRLYRPDLLYRGFSSSLIERVLRYGLENPNDHFVYANPEHFLSLDPDPQWINPLTYARSYGALAIYRGDLLRMSCFTCYEFPDLNTKASCLATVFLLRGRL